MGNSISRIEREFIIKALDDNKFRLRMHGLRKEVEVVIINYKDEEWVEVYSKERNLETFSQGERIRLFFSYYGHVMTFNSTIISCDEEKARITYPENILKRGYSITYHNGKKITDINKIKENDEILSKLFSGTIRSKVSNKVKNKNC